MTANSTICAISTAPGAGGIAVIRISGEDALTILDKVYEPAKKTLPIAQQETHTLSYGKVMNGENVLDEVIVAVFRSPHSYTGENTVEVTCHGSTYIQQEILRLLLKNGCSLAKPGEFTQRAFLNGKMDLLQAEAVADVVASASTASHRLAMNQMRGGFSKELQNLRSQLLHFVSLIELELDFSEEDVTLADRNQLLTLTLNIKAVITQLIGSFQLGNVIKNGISVVIVGETNVGKSTLLNYLLNEERALVSEVHGTTRDTIEDVINISGISFRFIDTAGIRDTGDEIEILGIERTYQKIDQASIVVWMIDATQFSERIEKVAEKIIPKTKEKELLIVINKIDLLSMEERLVLDEEFLPQIPAKRIYLSAKYKQNTSELEEALLKAADIPKLGEKDVVISNMRHYEALSKALESINRVEAGLKKRKSSDLLTQDIRECMHYLG
ncbi:MAG: tRNA uridine-5-carboxymethylaminomethyl(34) synthesis GTPase MnmE, partial [Dysgonamonadaceae bacterium]|nr:tRNA uridine-5-carboxymethylaminomethyl(34) synthesis GTPase MnmE [Dysgonamonadaceae bacterium]